MRFICISKHPPYYSIIRTIGVAVSMPKIGFLDSKTADIQIYSFISYHHSTLLQAIYLEPKVVFFYPIYLGRH